MSPTRKYGCLLLAAQISFCGVHALCQISAAAAAVDSSAAAAKELSGGSASSGDLEAEAMLTRLSLAEQAHLGDWFTASVPSFWTAFRHLKVKELFASHKQQQQQQQQHIRACFIFRRVSPALNILRLAALKVACSCVTCWFEPKTPCNY
jgi:hypothetical protein